MASSSSEGELSEDLRSILAALAHAPSWTGVPLRVAPGDRIGRYSLERAIGRGGFGVVFAARDDELGRQVAIKVTRGEPTADVLERFQREARVAARLNHPNLVTLHDSGVVAGLPYLVLELLDGETLAARLAGGPLPPRDALAILADVLRALATVHAAGIVHADLKPSNVFLTADGRVKVLDFGLAQLRAGDAIANGSGESSRGGTPDYMAPEQWRGEPLDARTDVFGAGALAFAMLDGASPFPDRARGSLAQVAPPVRRGSARVRALVAQALAPDPAARFPSADAMRAAVERAQRRRGVRLAIAAAAIAVVAGGAVVAVGAVRARRAAVASAQLAERAGREAGAIEADLRFARARPLHDIRREEAAIRARLVALAADVDAAGDASGGAVEVALARAQQALHDLPGARARLEAADRTPAVASALGDVMIQQYEEARDEVRTDEDPARRAAAIADLDRALRTPALALLREGGDLRPLVRAKIALYDGHFDEARALAASALAADPGLYEASALVALSYLHEQRERMDHDQGAAMLELATRAGEAAVRAAEIARSDPEMYALDCRRWNIAWRVAAHHGDYSDDVYRSALAACGRGLAADPTNPRVLHALATTYQQRAKLLGTTGVDPRPLIATALVQLDAGRRAHPDAADLASDLAFLALARAYYEQDHDLDPNGAYDAADAAFAAYAKLRPTGEGEQRRGSAEMLRAEWQLDHAIDPRPAVARALARLRAFPAARTQIDIGRALVVRGAWESAHGTDPRPTLDEAVAAFAHVGGDSPYLTDALSEESGAWQERATWERRNGMDAAGSFDRAIECSTRDVAANPKDVVARSNLGLALMSRAEAEVHRHGDPAPFLARAIAELEATHDLAPDTAAPLANLGSARELEARFAVAAHRDPRAAIAAGQRALADAQAINRDDVTALPIACQLERDAAEWEIEAHRSPLAAYGRAKTACEAALALDPDAAEPNERAAAILRDIAAYEVAHRLDASADIALGLQRADKALAANADAVDARAVRDALTALAAR